MFAYCKRSKLEVGMAWHEAEVNYLILSVSDLYTCRRGYVYWAAEDNPHKIERASLSDGADVTVLRTANIGEAFGRLIAVIVCSSP